MNKPYQALLDELANINLRAFTFAESAQHEFCACDYVEELRWLYKVQDEISGEREIDAFLNVLRQCIREVVGDLTYGFDEAQIVPYFSRTIRPEV